MNKQSQPQAGTLCPHLAAAALWMTKPPRTTRLSKKIRYARALGSAIDDLLAL